MESLGSDQLLYLGHLVSRKDVAAATCNNLIRRSGSASLYRVLLQETWTSPCMAGPRDLGLTIVHRQDWCKLTQKDVINVTKRL